jgi:hypothetical protein
MVRAGSVLAILFDVSASRKVVGRGGSATATTSDTAQNEREFRGENFMTKLLDFSAKRCTSAFLIISSRRQIERDIPHRASHSFAF